MSSSVHSTVKSSDRSDASGEARSDLEKTVIRQGELLDLAENPSHPSSPAESIGLRSSSEQLIGQQLDHFLIESLVGTGGMGAVFRGRDLRLDRVVAIKVVPIADRGAEAMRRFRVEAQSAAKLDHPNIARVYYVGETERWSYIVFEFVEGINLRELVFKQGLLTIDDAICLTRQVAEALQHANERRVVHRDIKPSNILITQSGQAKLVDMGLARTTELDRSTNDLTASGVTLGTFDYISPEQAHDPRSADVRSDIYSLGCTLYFLLTGSPPFPDGTALQKLLMHGTKMPDDPRFFRADISDSMIAILRKMMAKKPGDRYQDPVDLIHDLQTLAQIEGLTWTNETENAIIAPSTFQRTWFEATLPTVVSLVAIFGVMLWLQNTSSFPIPREEIADSLERPVPAEPVPEPSPSKQSSNPSPVVPTPLNNDATIPSAANLPNVEAASGSSQGYPTELVERDVIVVDPDSMTEKDKAGIVVRTIEQAIELANGQSQFRRIVVRASVITSSVASLKSTTAFSGNLTIQSDQGKRLRWNVDGADSSMETASTTWFECVSGQLILQDIDIVWRTNANSRRRSLFAIKPTAWLQWKDCSVTVLQDSIPTLSSQPFESPATSSNAMLPSVLYIDQASQENYSDATNTPTSRGAARVSGLKLVVRGHCDWLRLNGPVRTEVQLDNGWFAMAGSMFEMNGSRTPNRSGGTVRIDMKHVTHYSQRAWMRCSMNNSTPYPIPFVRTAKECVFAGCKSLIEWNATECPDWAVWEQTSRGQELARWIDLRGTDNVYDAATMVSYLQARLVNGKTEQIDLTSDANLVAEERGLETIAAWKKRPILETTKLYETTFSVFEWVSGAYQPGFQPQHSH